jgi:CheY-like chemotaxis protein
MYGGFVMSQYHILVVDDNIINLLVARKQLEVLGHRVTTVSSGYEALVAIQSTVFDVVFMDCQMPEMDGYETTRRIRLAEQGKKQKRLAIVAATTADASTVLAKCLAAGMDGYLGKPASLVDIKKLLDIFIAS